MNDKKHDDSSRSHVRAAIWSAVIGSIGVVVAAWIGVSFGRGQNAEQLIDLRNGVKQREAEIIKLNKDIAEFREVQNQSPSRSPAVPGDLTPVFGSTDRGQRVRLVPSAQYASLLDERFAKADHAIRIVTITGSSWLESYHMQRFIEATTRLRAVDLLLLDFLDKDACKLFEDAESEYSQGRWTQRQYVANLQKYAALLGSGRSLSLGLFNELPWTRFTIFDDKSVAFIITPNLVGGPGALTYYSEDPFIVHVFERWFDQLKRSARSRGRYFTSKEQVDSLIRASHMGPGNG